MITSRDKTCPVCGQRIRARIDKVIWVGGKGVVHKDCPVPVQVRAAS